MSSEHCNGRTNWKGSDGYDRLYDPVQRAAPVEKPVRLAQVAVRGVESVLGHAPNVLGPLLHPAHSHRATRA